jgi:hypothetical protein
MNAIHSRTVHSHDNVSSRVDCALEKTVARGARQSACHCSRDKNGGFDSIFQVIWGLGLRSKEYAQSAAAAHGAHISLLFALHSFLYATATYSSVRTGLPIPLFDVAGSIWLNHAERPARGRATLSSLAVLLGAAAGHQPPERKPCNRFDAMLWRAQRAVSP